MDCPKCGQSARFVRWIVGKSDVFACEGCVEEFTLKDSALKDPQNFVFTPLEQVMATRIDCPTGPG